MKKIFAVLFVLAALAGCGGKEGRCHSCPTEPTVCSFTSIEPSFANFTSAGGTGSFRVNKSGVECASCANVTTNDSWIRIVSVGSVVEYRVDPGSTAVEGKILACGFEFRVKREGTTPCSYTAVPTRDDRPNCEAGEGSFSVIVTGTSCPFNPVSDSPSWLTIVPGCPTCTTVTYRYTRNDTGATRTGIIRVGTCEYRVTQPPCPPTPSCSFVVQPTSRNFSCPGGTATFTVTTQSGCSWFAETGTPWITITQGSTWTSGSGSVTISVPTNGSSSRSGSLTIAGQTISITQEACTTSSSCTRSGRVEIPVTETFTCPDGSVQSATVTVTGRGSGTSDNCTDAQNKADAEAQRNADSQVPAAREQARALAQAKCPSCTYLVPTSTEDVEVSGTTNGQFFVNTSPNSGCGWTAAVTSGSWLMLTISSGQGDGPVQFNASSNSGARREGVITVTENGTGITHPVRVPQKAGTTTSCTYLVPNSTELFEASGTGNGQFFVNTSPNSGCGWTAAVTSGSSWLVITDGTSGSGDGPVKLFVGGNLGPAREGEVTVTENGTGVAHRVRIPQKAGN